MAQPTDLPEWATGGSAEITEPTDQEKASGWVQEDVPPHQYVNWFWNLVYQWIAHLFGASARWDSLNAFIDGTIEGDTGIVAEYDGDLQFASSISTVTPAGGATLVATSGQYLFVISGTNLRIYARDLGTLVRTIATGFATLRAVCTNGDFVCVAGDNSVRCYEVDDGTTRWTYNHTVAVRDVCTDGTFVYMCGNPAAGITAKKLLATTGALQWSFQHSGGAEILQCIATDGQRVYLAGQASSYASGATMRAIDQSSGADLTNEGGLGTAAVGYAWNIAGTAFLADGDGCIATDGRLLLVGHPTASANSIQVLGVSTGEVLYTLAAAATAMASPPQCAIDTDLMVVVGDDGAGAGAIEFIDKKTFARVLRLAPLVPFTGVCSDSGRIFLVGDGIIRRASRGTTRPRVWRRVDPTDRYLPYRLLAIPEE